MRRAAAGLVRVLLVWVAFVPIIPFVACAASASRPLAEAGACPVCGKPVADGPEVRVQLDGESAPGSRYRCFMCPLMEKLDATSWTLRAASAVDGRPVTFRVDGDRVTADPPGAVVLARPVGPGDECLDVHCVFAGEDEFRRYVDARPALAGARPQTFAEVLERTRSGR